MRPYAVGMAPEPFASSFANAVAGFGAGLLVAAAAGWWATRVLTRRARQAEGRARAAEHLAEIGSMTGGLAHEIKNPLSTIAMNTQLLAEAIDEVEGVDSQEAGRLVRRAGTLKREVERLGDILNDFLEFAGEMRLSPSRHDLNQVVEELADFFLPQAESQGVRLRVELATEPAWVEIDSTRLKQAILNLMINATQALASADAEIAKELMLRVRPLPREGAIELHVPDTGPGITEETAERIFRPYFTTKAGGSGLGLPTSRRIIQASGGELSFTSEAGRGSDFVIALPLGPS